MFQNCKGEKLRIIFADLPTTKEKYSMNYPNLGILYLIAYLRSKINNLKIHYDEAQYNIKEKISKIEEIQPDIYFLSFASLTSKLAYETIEVIKEQFIDLPIICGGPHPTVAPHEVFKKSKADICVRGEGEETVYELVEYFKKYPHGDSNELKKIKGIAYKENGDVICTEKRSLIENLDDIPIPAWDLVDLNKYVGNQLRMNTPSTCITTSRGCPYNCVYCSNPVWKENKPWLRMRSPQNIVEEIKLLYNKGIRELYIRADEFNANLNWSIEVCNEIKELGYNDLYFQCNLHAGLFNEELAKSLGEINCWMVHIGIESGNQRVLDGIQKHITLEQVENTCKLLKKYGIKIFGFFMMYQTWEEDGKLFFETPEEVDNSIRFIKKLYSQNLLDYISWGYATPFPGSKLYDVAEKYNLFKTNNEIKSIWEININLPGVSEKSMKKSRRKGMLYQSYYALKSGGINWRDFENITKKIKYIIKSY